MNSRQTVIETDDLAISFSPGTSGTAIVSFSGIGQNLGSIPPAEFAHTLRAGGHNHALFFVSDRRRSWFNETGDAICGALCPRLTDYDRVVTLGNSMGGFGALHFSGLLPRCSRAIAFVPQFFVAPDSAEMRWRELRARIVTWRIADATGTISDACPCIVAYGRKAIPDHWHIDQMKARLTPPHRVFEVSDCGHDLATVMRARGILAPFIAAAIDGAEYDALKGILAGAGLSCS